MPAASRFAALGFLRLSLYALALLNILLSVVALRLAAASAEPAPWVMVLNYVTPVMAPLFVVVIFFDYVMSRIRAADTQGAEQELYIWIGRLELIVIGINLLYWVPLFGELMA